MYWSLSRRGGILEAGFGCPDEAAADLICGLNACVWISGYGPPHSLTLRVKASGKSVLGNVLPGSDEGVHTDQCGCA